MFRCALVGLLLVSAYCQADAAQPPATLVTTRAELANKIDSRTLRPGEAFFLKTVTTWQEGACTIRANTTITGEVVAVELKKDGPRRTALSVRFSPVSCSDQESLERVPVLVAMQGPPPPEDSGLKRMQGVMQEQGALQSMFNPNPPPAVVTQQKVANNSSNAAQVINTVGFNGGGNAPLKTGQVSGVRGVTMELPQTDTATTLFSSHEVALERRTQFVLLFALPPTVSHEVTFKVKAPSSATVLSRTPAKAAVPPPEETEVCAASGCRQLVAAGGAGASGKAVWSLPLSGLGFAPRPDKTIVALDDDTSIHFIGDDALLFTFNRHALIHRSAEQAERGWRPRNIRAVLLSRADGRVLRVEDWTVSDAEGPFVWSLGQGRLLAHVGGELRIYGADLAVQGRYSLPGPLVFASVSPGAELVLAATLHERHTKQEHEKLAKFLGPDFPVEEDYDLTGLDGKLQLIGTRRMDREPLQPAMLQAAMVSARPDRADRWNLEEASWTGQTKTLARLASGCEMAVQSLPGDLLFAHGCTAGRAEIAWYRVLNPQGATLLKGKLEPFSLLQQAATDEAGKLFAVASTQFEKRVDLRGSMHAGDFAHLSVAVYSTATGRQVFAVQPAGGSDMRETFALSPSGNSLAVLTGDTLQTYGMAPEPSIAASVGSR